jgi:hypothetical protein
MRDSWYYPITSEPAGAKPVYGEKIDMGHAVKGYLSITTASGEIPGDDITQVSIEKFVSGQLDAETTMSDLEVNAKIYGHKFTEADGEVSSSDDVSPNGGYAFIEPILLKDKTIVFRATCLHKVSAMASSEKQEADTKKSGELSFKNNAVSYKVMETAQNTWRSRKEFATHAEAQAYIEAFYAAT